MPNLAAREASMRANGGSGGQQVNNWPFKFWAFAYHNIDAEIPPQHQKAAACVLLLLRLLIFGVVHEPPSPSPVRLSPTAEVVSWLVAIIYFVVGVPGAYFIWYRRLYMAAKTTRV